MRKVLFWFLLMGYMFVAHGAQITQNTGWGNSYYQPVADSFVGGSVAITPSCVDECSITGNDCGAGKVCMKNSKTGCRYCESVEYSKVEVTCPKVCVLLESDMVWKQVDSYLYQQKSGCLYFSRDGQCEPSYTYSYACASGYYLGVRGGDAFAVAGCIKCPAINNSDQVVSSCKDYTTENGTVCLNTSQSVTSCYLEAQKTYTDETGTFELAGDCHSG